LSKFRKCCLRCKSLIYDRLEGMILNRSPLNCWNNSNHLKWTYLTISLFFTIKIFRIKNPSAEPRDLSKINYLAFMCQIHQGTMIIPFEKPKLLSFHLLSICGFSKHKIVHGIKASLINPPTSGWTNTHQQANPWNLVPIQLSMNLLIPCRPYSAKVVGTLHNYLLCLLPPSPFLHPPSYVRKIQQCNRHMCTPQ
jgi:hypothetical protein